MRTRSLIRFRMALTAAVVALIAGCAATPATESASSTATGTASDAGTSTDGGFVADHWRGITQIGIGAAAAAGVCIAAAAGVCIAATAASAPVVSGRWRTASQIFAAALASEPMTTT